MNDILLDIAIASGENVLSLAVKRVVSRLKTESEYKKSLLEIGDFFSNFESNDNDFRANIEDVFSQDNVALLVKDIWGDSGYDVKSKLLARLHSILDVYNLPREIERFYSNNILNAIVNQVKEIDPEKYSNYFQSEWKQEQEATLNEIRTLIEKIYNEITKAKSLAIAMEAASDLDVRLRRSTKNPRIGIDFFDIDDEQFKKKFTEVKDNEVISVRARNREEAVYCILNELWNLDEKRVILVVKDLMSWNKLIESGSKGNIYIPLFWADEIPSISENTNIFIYSDGIPSFSQDEIELRPRLRQTICNALVRAGMAVDEANILVDDTNGLYASMKKKIFNGQMMRKPEWVSKLPNRVKHTCLLLGQWTDQDGDKNIVSALSGMEYGDFISIISPYISCEDPFIYLVERYSQKTYYLADVENSWEYLDVSVDDSLWQNFIQIFKGVLSKAERSYSYSYEERIKAQITGEKDDWSINIRQGMIRSVIMKAIYKDDSRVQNELDRMVEEILGSIKSVDQWKYIAHFFAELCEMSPDSVLKRMNKELVDSTGLVELFEAQSSNPLFDKNFSYDVLIGVEEFLVQDEYASQGLLWLGRLDNILSERGRTRVKDIIEMVLCTWMNFSVYKTAEDKRIAASSLFDTTKNAWDYILEALPENNRSVFGELHRPMYRDCVSRSETKNYIMNKTTREYIELLINHAELTVNRWLKILDVAYYFSDEQFEKVMSLVEINLPQFADIERASVKNRIRHIINKHRMFASSFWAMEEAKIERYEDLLNKIKIETPEYEYIYLFDSRRDKVILHPEPYDGHGHNKNDSQIDHEISEKIKEFITRNLSISKLVEGCSCFTEETTKLGLYLAWFGGEKSFNQDIFRTLYLAPEQKWWSIDYCRGIYKEDNEVINKALKLKKELAFDVDTEVELYRVQIEDDKADPLIASASDEVKKRFWTNANLFVRSNYRWALEECGRFGSAGIYIELLYRANQECKFDNDTLLKCLDTSIKLKFEARMDSAGYYLKEILSSLQVEGERNPDVAKKIALIEIHYFIILDWNDMKCFQSEIKRSPELFGEMVSILYKKDEIETTNEHNEISTDYYKIMYRLYDKTRFCPAEKNGQVDYGELVEWVDEFRNILKKNHQESLFGFFLGRLWSFSPVGRDNYYPCEAVRDVIEKYADDSMVSEYVVAICNQRGVFSPSAGRAERALAEQYKEMADYLKFSHPNTAKAFYSVSRKYMNDAEYERRIAESGE